MKLILAIGIILFVGLFGYLQWDEATRLAPGDPAPAPLSTNEDGVVVLGWFVSPEDLLQCDFGTNAVREAVRQHGPRVQLRIMVPEEISDEATEMARRDRFPAQIVSLRSPDFRETLRGLGAPAIVAVHSNVVLGVWSNGTPAIRPGINVQSTGLTEVIMEALSAE